MSIKERGFGSPLILVCLFLILTVGIILYLVLKPQLNNTILNLKTDKTIQITPAPTSSISELPKNEISVFAKKQFGSEDKFAGDETYPMDLINAKDNDLVGMKCTPPYHDSIYGPGDPDFYLDGKHGTKHQDVLSDNDKKKLMNDTKISEQILSGAQFCKAEDGRIVWLLETNYMSPNQASHFQLQPYGETNREVVKIAGNTYGWFSCKQPLMLTKSGILYYQCQGGSMNVRDPKTTQIIFSIDLNNNTYKEYYKKLGSKVPVE